MSINTSSLFNRIKISNQPIPNSRISENQLFSMQRESQPTKVDYSWIKEIKSKNIHLSENMITNISEINQIEKRNNEVFQEEKFNNENKFNSPKITTRNNLISNLPTANNSYIENMSSPDFDKNHLDEYQGLAANNYYRGHQMAQSRKNSQQLMQRKRTDESLDGDFNSISSLNNSINIVKSKKSEDFKTKFKTEICKFWQLEKNCKFKDNCAFAHGSVDMRNKSSQPSHYRTRKCKQFTDIGFCPYGNRCQFAHNNKKNYFSYKNSIIQLSKCENTENLKFYLTNCNRLNSFIKLSKSKDLNLSANFIDDFISVRNNFSKLKIFTFNQIQNIDNIYNNCIDDVNNRSRVFTI